MYGHITTETPSIQPSPHIHTQQHTYTFIRILLPNKGKSLCSIYSSAFLLGGWDLKEGLDS